MNLSILTYFLPCLLIVFFSTGYSSAATAVLYDTTSISDSGKVDCQRLAVVATVTAATITYGITLQNSLWWKGERSPFYFNFERDWKYALGADKFGHFFFPYLVAGEYSQLLEWCAIDTVDALWYAAALGLAHQTFVEVRDGFSKDMGGGYLGFSWADMGANIAGAVFPLVQQKSKLLQSVMLKISYYPSDAFQRGTHAAIIDDYESTYHWLSFSPAIFLPGTLARQYPPWLNLALGHSVKNLDGNGGGNHEIFLSVDWNLAAISVEGSFWKTLIRTLGYYHFPAPAVRLYPSVVWYGLKF